MFSYTARPLRLRDGESVILVPAGGAHLDPQTEVGAGATGPSHRASALQAHAARTAKRMRKAG